MQFEVLLYVLLEVEQVSHIDIGVSYLIGKEDDFCYCKTNDTKF